MNPPALLPWPEANQRYLAAAVRVVRSHLERVANRTPEHESLHQDLLRQESDAAAALPSPSALDLLVKRFGLSEFERTLILLGAGPELDATFHAACAAAQGTTAAVGPSFGLALAALPLAHWDALAPTRPLRHWRLVNWLGGESLTQARLRLDERILFFITGVASLDERLSGLVASVSPQAGELPSLQEKIADRLAAAWRVGASRGNWRLVQLCGDSGDIRQVAARACEQAGLALYVIAATDIPSVAAERENLSRIWQREAVLEDRVLLVELDSHDSPETLRHAVAWVGALDVITVVGGREPLGLTRPARRFDLARPEAREQLSLWQRALGPSAAKLNGQLGQLVTQFNLGSRAIEAAAAEAVAMPEADAKTLADELWAVCRRNARLRLDDLAQRIEPAAGWNDLVLPAATLQCLRTLEVQVRQRATVHEAWGFAAKNTRGLGINALFAGPSGTGKTMAAEVLAGNLRLDLYRIDLSSVVSKYIGETEKNLRKIFDAAEAGGAILLFDEADALFGKRTEVRDSHDRYANIEVSYLLQRIEAYQGLAILTTNLKETLDDAFLRRLRFVVEFPFPDASGRQEIWRKVFPAKAPTADLDYAKLARLNLAGGNIRNVALHAAFLAAENGEAIGMSHLLSAARHEYAKLERPLMESETRGWM